jgi:hypothetical protein
MNMSKIKVDQINDNEVLVSLPADAPMEIVQQLIKSLSARGLVEDVRNSTLSSRSFYRPTSNSIADELIKSLQGLVKDDDNTWHMNKPGAAKAFNAQQRRIDEENRTKRSNMALKQRSTMNIAPEPGPNVLPPKTNKLYDPNLSNKTSYKKNEDSGDDVEKSGYGPKGSGQYTPEDNAKRKANNTGTQIGAGPNVNVKQYTTVKPAGSQTDPKLKKPQPVKVYSEEEKTALAVKMGLKKNTAWGQHLPHPNAEVELAKMRQHNQISPEDLLAQQLYNVMSGKAMLGQQPPPQPTDEQMFGQYVVTEEMAKKADEKWGNTFNNWLVEASKPISQRFESEEAELAYWKSLKVDDRDDGSSGY